MGQLRLIPVVLFAATALLALKLAGLVAGHGYSLTGPPSAQAQVSVPAAPGLPKAEAPVVPPQIAKRSWAQENLGYPDVTGSVSSAKPASPPPPASPAPPASGAKPNGSGEAKAAPANGTGAIDPEKPTIPAGERAVLERLGERRQELETQARELEIREGLLKAAEAKLEARLAELAELEGRINSVSGKKSEAEAARFKGLVSMYENMKAKDAAKIFDRLDLKILVDVVTQMNPRRMSDVLAQMSPEAAERLTVELAGKSPLPGAKPAPLAELPKIEGKPRM